MVAPLPGADLPEGRQPARVPGLPRSQRPRHLLRHRQVREHQHRLRSHVSRSGRSPSICGTRRSAEALTSVASATRSFWKVTTPQTVTIIPDTQAKRREYQEEVVRTFYLSNADLKETIDILRIVVDAQASGGDDRHQRHHHQGHARAGDGGGPHHHRHRQGAAGSRHRRRAAGSRPHPPAASTACRSPRPGTRRPASTARWTSMRRIHAARPPVADAAQTST